MIKNILKDIYEKHYKLLLVFPMALLLLSLISLGLFYNETGDFVNKGISLKGGTSLTVLSDIATEEEISEIIDYSGEINSRVLSSSGKQMGIIIEIDETDSEKINSIKESILNKYNLKDNDITVETMGSSLGSSFFKETIRAMIFAFIFMGIVVFLYFRTIVPSLAAILSAFSDIIITIAVVNTLGIKVSTAGIAAFLMLIGYSIDTDILLSTKVIKRKDGTIDERIYSAMKTGLMMTFTTIIAIVIALIFSQSPVISQIMQILLIGLIIDLMNTWIQNAGMLKWYMEAKK